MDRPLPARARPARDGELTLLREGRCIGLVGGLGVGATVTYYQALTRALTARGVTPRLLISHAESDRVLGAVRDGDLAGLTAYLADHLQHLADGGAAFAAIPAITPQIVAPQLAARSSLPLIDPIDGIVNAIAARGLRRVALFGTRFVIERRLFDRLGAVEIVQPTAAVIGQIHDAYVALVQAGTGSDAIRAHLRTVAHALCRDAGAEAIVLAGTELSLVFDPATTDFPAVDATALHLDAIIARAVA